MDPVTLFFAAIAGGGKLFEGFAGAAASELQGKIAEGNTRLLRGQADFLDTQADVQETGIELARAKGAFEQTRLRDKISRVLASQPGHYAAAGLSATSVSPLVAAGFSASQGQADLEIIQANAELEAAQARNQAAGTRVQAANVRGQAAASSWQELALHQRAFNSKVAGIFGAATAMLGASKNQFASVGGDATPGYYGGSPESNPMLVPYGSAA